MILLCVINNNILILHLSYSGVYQVELKTRALQLYKYVFGVGTKPKKLTNSGENFSVNIGIFKYPIEFLMGAGCSGLI